MGVNQEFTWLEKGFSFKNFPLGYVSFIKLIWDMFISDSRAIVSKYSWSKHAIFLVTPVISWYWLGIRPYLPGVTSKLQNIETRTRNQKA